MLVDKNHITTLIPQRDPFIMIDALIEKEDPITSSIFEVRADNMMVEHARFSPEGIIENIAQTAAAGAGFEFATKNEAPPIGYIGAVSKLRILGSAPVGATIKTNVEVTNAIMNVSIIKGTCYLDGNLLAECVMKIFIDEGEG